MANALTSRAIFTVLALTLSGPVLAQGGPGMMGGRGGDGQGWGGMGWHMWGGPGSGWGGGWQQWGRGPEGMLDRIDGRLAFLKTELKITDAQQTQWTRFADAMRTNAKSMNERMKSIWSGEEKAKTLTERLDLHEQMMTARLEEVRQLKSAFADLYAVLDDQQKKEADTLALPMMGMGGGMGGGGPMGPGMMWRRG
jgi:hypothetical protein